MCHSAVSYPGQKSTFRILNWAKETVLQAQETELSNVQEKRTPKGQARKRLSICSGHEWQVKKNVHRSIKFRLPV